MRKLKKKLVFLSIFIALTSCYLKTEPHHKECQYEILDDSDAFAKCSFGTIYIGSKDFLESIPDAEGNILVEDQRSSKNGDPNMQIYNSSLIHNREEQNAILEVLMEYERLHPSDWNRTIESMRLEWLMHNLGYQFHYEMNRTGDVDLNNADEEKYDSKVLQKIFRLT